LFVFRPTCTGKYLEESSQCKVKPMDVELFVFEMPWLTLIIVQPSNCSPKYVHCTPESQPSALSLSKELSKSSLVVDMFTTTRTGTPLRIVSCAGHRTELSSFLGVSRPKGATMNATIRNPFLTLDVNTACDEARVLYLDTLARMQQNGGQPVDWLERLRQQSQRNLDNYWDAALKLACADHIQGASAQLASIVKEWGLYRALADLIDADASCCYLDPADPDTYNDIQRAIEHQVAYLATELLTAWLDGSQRRKADQLRQQQDWQGVAYQQVQQHLQRQTAWHDAAFQMLQEQRTAWQTGHQVAQQWSNVALNGVEQAQRGVQQMYTFAVTVQSNVAGMLAGTEERQYMIMEEAVDRATWRRRRSRLTVVLIMAVSVPLLFLLAYFLITHLY
jgi:hypothetical protein